jgi:hypothetical protein
MPLYDVRCPQGHEAERWASFDERAVPCGECGQPTERIWRANRGARAPEVTWPGGKVFVNGFETAQTFYSPKEHRDALASRGLKVRGDGEESGGWMSPGTLKNAEAMVKRCS